MRHLKMSMTEAMTPLSPKTKASEPAMLDAAHLSRSFGTRIALDDVPFQVAPGQTDNGDRPGREHHLRDVGWMYVAAGNRPPVGAPGRVRHSSGMGGEFLGDRVVGRRALVDIAGHLAILAVIPWSCSPSHPCAFADPWSQRELEPRARNPAARGCGQPRGRRSLEVIV